MDRQFGNYEWMRGLPGIPWEELSPDNAPAKGDITTIVFRNHLYTCEWTYSSSEKTWKDYYECNKTSMVGWFKINSSFAAESLKGL